MEQEYNLDCLAAWSKDKHPLIVCLAYESVTAADAICYAVSAAKKSKRVGCPNDLMIEYWLSLYRNGNKLLQFAIEDIGDGSSANEICEIFKFLQELKRINVRMKKSEYARRITHEVNEFLNGEFKAIIIQMYQDGSYAKFIDAMIESAKVDVLQWIVKFSKQQNKFNKQMDVRLFFYANIWIPCAALYKSTPTELFRKARCGNDDALKKLIALDDTILHDRLIAKHHIHKSITNSSQCKMLWEAASKKPTGSAARATVKAQIASYLILLSKLISHYTPYPPLTAPQLQALFDAYARDAKRGEYDGDFKPNQPGSFEKMINRRMKELGFLLKLPRMPLTSKPRPGQKKKK